MTAPVGTPAPTVTPAPTPTPAAAGTCTNSAGQVITTPSNIVMQVMYAGGTNNYAYDSSNYVNDGRSGSMAPPDPNTTVPMNTIQVFELPKTWRDGGPLTYAQPSFSQTTLVNSIGAQYEVAFSKCKGDFSYYQTPQASYSFYPGGAAFVPCGLIHGDSFPVAWTTDPTRADSSTCVVPPSETWYMNWRVVPGTCPTTTGHTCGQVFSVPRSN